MQNEERLELQAVETETLVSDEQDLGIREVSLDEIEQIEDTFIPAWGFGCGAGC